MKVDAGGKELKMEITIVRNDRGYGIYQLRQDETSPGLWQYRKGSGGGIPDIVSVRREIHHS